MLVRRGDLDRLRDEHDRLRRRPVFGVVFPVLGWWIYDIMYITPFLAIPYLHTVNREIFTD